MIFGINYVYVLYLNVFIVIKVNGGFEFDNYSVLFWNSIFMLFFIIDYF